MKFMLNRAGREFLVRECLFLCSTCTFFLPFLVHKFPPSPDAEITKMLIKSATKLRRDCFWSFWKRFIYHWHMIIKKFIYCFKNDRFYKHLLMIKLFSRTTTAQTVGSDGCGLLRREWKRICSINDITKFSANVQALVKNEIETSWKSIWFPFFLSIFEHSRKMTHSFLVTNSPWLSIPAPDSTCRSGTNRRRPRPSMEVTRKLVK